eukprot:gene12006-15273_t
MLQPDVESIAAVGSRGYDLSGAGGQDRRARRRRKIHA